MRADAEALSVRRRQSAGSEEAGKTRKVPPKNGEGLLLYTAAGEGGVQVATTGRYGGLPPETSLTP
jgi:hypothetical protein